MVLLERNGAFSDILHTNPHLVGRSHPVSVEVREFDWDSSRKGASQLPRTTTIRLSSPKTTTGEILIFALTSPLIQTGAYFKGITIFMSIIPPRKLFNFQYWKFAFFFSFYHNAVYST